MVYEKRKHVHRNVFFIYIVLFVNKKKSKKQKTNIVPYSPSTPMLHIGI